MNEYEFEVEHEEGFYLTFRTFATNKLTAYEELTQYLIDSDIDPEAVRVLNVYVDTKEN